MFLDNFKISVKSLLMKKIYEQLEEQIIFIKNLKEYLIILAFIFLITAGLVQFLKLLNISWGYLNYFSFDGLARDVLLMIPFFVFVFLLVTSAATLLDFIVNVVKRVLQKPYYLWFYCMFGACCICLFLIMLIDLKLGVIINCVILLLFGLVVLGTYIIFFDEKDFKEFWRIFIFILYVSSSFYLWQTTSLTAQSIQFLMDDTRQAKAVFIYHNNEYVFLRSKNNYEKVCVMPFSSEFLRTGRISEVCQRYLDK